MKVSERFYFSPEFAHLSDELDGLSDRAVAIVGASSVDDGLAEAIKSRLLDEPKAIQTQFSGNGGLSTFSAKIDMGRLLGMYSSGVWADLHKIRKIRNHAAHSAAKFAFSDSPARDHAMSLTVPEKYLVESGDKGKEGEAMLAAKNLPEVLSSPALRFIGTALLAAYQFSLGAKYGTFERIVERGKS